MKIPDTIRRDTTALIIIDMQRAYFNAGELQTQKTQLAARCNRLISAFRAAHRPVIFVRTAHTRHGETWTLNMHDDEQGYLFDGTDEVQMIEELAVDDTDTVLTKLRDSAFHATILEQVLREQRSDTLVLAGVSTQTCVGQTAADAYARNFRVILAVDAIGTHDSTYHEPTLTMLAQEYRQTRVSGEDIARWIRTEGGESA